MTIIVSPLTVSEAVTVINVLIALIQNTLPLLLAVLLIHFMPKINSAIAWNSINQALHSTLWPTVLRADSDRTSQAGFVIRGGSFLFTLSTILLAIVSVALPLGLRDGPPRPSTSPISLNATYVQDTSALSLATTPNRDSFTYGSKCPMNDTTGCDLSNVTTVPSQLSDIFHNTSHTALSIQYRQFYNTEGQAASSGYVGSAQVLMLRNDTFAVEGLVVDMSAAHPGLGFINHTIPKIQDATTKDDGGTWSQDVLFLEPVTSCVDTNLTFEYVLEAGFAFGVVTAIEEYNITDRGGFYNAPNITLENIIVPADYNSQNLDLGLHAYIGAALSNEQAMIGLNTSRSNSFPNKTYTATQQNGGFGLPGYLNRIVPFELGYFILPAPVANLTNTFAVNLDCVGFGGLDPASIDTVNVQCGVLFGPPLRTDGGDNNIYDAGSTWRQSLHACASATRASIQTFTFSLPSFNDSSIQQLNVTREPTKHTVLWGMEKSNLSLAESYPLWGRIDENQDTSALWTIESDHFMLPASYASFNFTLLPEGSPQNAHAPVWFWVYNPLGITPYLATSLSDYTGRSDYSIKSKYQDLVVQYGQGVGAEMILNLIWTDIMSNQMLGTMKSDTLDVSVNARSLEYDFRFAIPGYLLALIWLPVFVVAIILLVSRQVRWSYMAAYFNHLSIGRIVTGQSALGVIGGMGSKPITLEGTEYDGRKDSNWGKTIGRTAVMLDLDRDRRSGSTRPETMGLMTLTTN